MNSKMITIVKEAADIRGKQMEITKGDNKTEG